MGNGELTDAWIMAMSLAPSPIARVNAEGI